MEMHWAYDLVPNTPKHLERAPPPTPLPAPRTARSFGTAMTVADITAKAKVLLEALPYIQDFRGSTFVVKYGGSFMDDPDPVVRTRVAADIAFFAACGVNVVVVHGGGKAISRAMEAAGLKPQFVNGHRVYRTFFEDGSRIRLGHVVLLFSSEIQNPPNSH